MTAEPQESVPDAGTTSLVAAVTTLVVRGAALHLAVGAGTVAWDWWRQQRRRAAMAVPRQTRTVVRALLVVQRRT